MNVAPSTIGVLPGAFRHGPPSTPVTNVPKGSVLDSSERRRFGRLLIYGLLWSVVLVVLEMPTVSYDMPHDRLAATMLHFAFVWIPNGFVLAVGIHWSTMHLVDWRRLAVAIPLAALCGSVPSFLVQELEVRFVGRAAVDWVLGTRYQTFSVLVYSTWLGTAYGGLAAVLYALRRQIDVTTATLRGTALARERNEASIADARFQAMVERIEPQFLLDVMDAARRQYRDRPESAERTLDACVAFLRSAMPQLRSGTSSVASELRLARDYLRLVDCMRESRCRWRVDRIAPGSHVDLSTVALPPMALLRPLDRAAVAASQEGDEDHVVITITIDDDVEIRVRVPRAHDADEAFEAEWLEALDLRLALACGPDATARVDLSDARDVTLTIVVPTGPRHSPDPIDRPDPRRSP